MLQMDRPRFMPVHLTPLTCIVAVHQVSDYQALLGAHFCTLFGPHFHSHFLIQSFSRLGTSIFHQYVGGSLFNIYLGFKWYTESTHTSNPAVARDFLAFFLTDRL